MTKIKGLLILICLYLLVMLSIFLDINLFYPFKLTKDFLLYPVRAINSDNYSLSEKNKDLLIDALRDEISSLKEINNIKSIISDYEPINATVIERNRMYWFNSLTIDKGSSDGIENDMAVINQDGLIGRISSVRPFTSDIKLITTNDINNKISIMVINGDDKSYGILNGYNSDNNTLKVTLNSKNNSILKGNLVYTTGMGGIFPSNILIGQVMEIKHDNYEVSDILLVSPSVTIGRERYVSVLKRK